jgi:tRNA G18 (ribose-2'-O)-methylase SpoU
MAVKSHKYKNQGFFGIGIMNNVNGLNIGTLWRSAYIMGASYIFTIDKKYKSQMSDVTKTWKKIPLYHYKNFDEFYDNQPTATRIIAVELDEKATMLAEYEHPNQACYLLGNEQAGLSQKVLKRCHGIVQLPGNFSLNVAVAGSILMYDRVAKLGGELPQ